MMAIFTNTNSKAISIKTSFIAHYDGQILIFFKYVKHCLAKIETLLVISLIQLLDYRNYIRVKP